MFCEYILCIIKMLMKIDIERTGSGTGEKIKITGKEKVCIIRIY